MWRGTGTENKTNGRGRRGEEKGEVRERGMESKVATLSNASQFSMCVVFFLPIPSPSSFPVRLYSRPKRSRMITQFYILSSRGDSIIYRNFRYDIARSTAETFFRSVRFWDGKQQEVRSVPLPLVLLCLDPLHINLLLWFNFLNKLTNGRHRRLPCSMSTACTTCG